MVGTVGIHGTINKVETVDTVGTVGTIDTVFLFKSSPAPPPFSLVIVCKRSARALS